MYLLKFCKENSRGLIQKISQKCLPLGELRAILRNLSLTTSLQESDSTTHPLGTEPYNKDYGRVSKMKHDAQRHLNLRRTTTFLV